MNYPQFRSLVREMRKEQTTPGHFARERAKKLEAAVDKELKVDEPKPIYDPRLF